MAKSLNFKGKSIFSWLYRNTNGLSDPRDEIVLPAYVLELEDGSGSGQANRMIVRQTSVLPNADNSYDLAGGVADAFGDTLTFATVKFIFLKNHATGSNQNLHIGGGPNPTGGNLITTIFTGGGDAGARIRAGGHFEWYAPVDGAAVTGGSADILRIYNAYSAAISYDLIVIGTA